MTVHGRILRVSGMCVVAGAWLAIVSSVEAAPAGYVKQTIPLAAPPVGLAFDALGTLYALEAADSGDNVATLRSILSDGSLGTSFPVVGDDPGNFFIGSMAYDPLADRLLISDNTGDGRLYAVDKLGVQSTVAMGIAGIAGVAVRDSGQIFVSTAPFGAAGEVRLVDRATAASTLVLGELGFGAGLALDNDGHLLVQDAATTTPFRGRLQRLPIEESAGGLVFGAPTPVADNMQSAAGVAVDSEGDFFTTGVGGLFQLAGTPAAETPFDANGSESQFATAIAFDAGLNAFEPFAGPQGGRLALLADFGFAAPDLFVTLITPAVPEDFNSDGVVNGDDLAIWKAEFGLAEEATPARGDANGDGQVDGADLLAWQRAVGSSTLLPVGIGGLSATSVVPEPTAAGLAWAVVGGVIALRGRRRASNNPLGHPARKYASASGGREDC